MGRPPHKNRDQILTDLDWLDLDVPVIARRNDASVRTVYTVAEENGVDMVLRRNLIEARKRKRAVDREVEELTRKWFS